MIIGLHGFLGSPKDFDFLRSELDLYTPNLDQYVSKSPDVLQHEILSEVDSENNILIGYSFGARLAIGLFLRTPEKFKKLILLGGHAGLKHKAERLERQKFEQSICLKIKESSFDQLLTFWNGLDLFEKDSPINSEFKDPDVLQDYFKNYGLSKQPFYLDDLRENQSKVTWMFGAGDHKYVTYAKENLSGFNVNYIDNCGHRVLHNSVAREIVIEEISNG